MVIPTNNFRILKLLVGITIKQWFFNLDTIKVKYKKYNRFLLGINLKKFASLFYICKFLLINGHYFKLFIELNDDHIINHINFNSKINNIWVIKWIYIDFWLW